MDLDDDLALRTLCVDVCHGFVRLLERKDTIQHWRDDARVDEGRDLAKQIVREYLSPQHRDNPEDGCPSAALLDEISRCSKPTRQAYTGSGLAFIDEIAARLAPRDPQSVRTTVLSVYALMVGTLQLSRTLTDPQLADDLLEHGIRNALKMLRATPPR